MDNVDYNFLYVVSGTPGETAPVGTFSITNQNNEELLDAPQFRGFTTSQKIKSFNHWGNI